MVKKTYSLDATDMNKLVSYALRYRRVSTFIDETHDTMTVYTSFADNAEPTSIADRFTLNVVSEAAPGMPEEEYRRRIKGEFV